MNPRFSNAPAGRCPRRALRPGLATGLKWNAPQPPPASWTGWQAAGRFALSLFTASLIAGCATGNRLETSRPPAQTPPERPTNLALTPEVEERILALDPDHITEADIQQTLADTPAPRVINIHGGLLPIRSSMVSFAEFLISMGYPAASVRQPGTGSYTFGYYHSSDRIAGMVAWFYEQEGLRPMLVGHSQGGIQVIRVLYRLAGDPEKSLSVWNPYDERPEGRDQILDPLTGRSCPVVGLRVPFAAVSVAGGLARILPHQWSMNSRLRRIPDSVEEFTGFQKGLDLLGGDFLGYGPANQYRPLGTALVRNVRLPASYAHGNIPNTRHLANDPETRNWINRYQPANQPDVTPRVDAEFHSDSSNIIWAAEVWFSIKRHWVIELQRAILARRARPALAGQP